MCLTCPVTSSLEYAITEGNSFFEGKCLKC